MKVVLSWTEIVQDENARGPESKASKKNEADNFKLIEGHAATAVQRLPPQEDKGPTLMRCACRDSFLGPSFSKGSKFGSSSPSCSVSSDC